MTQRQAESALVVLVPEAESLVGSFRTRYDPSAAVGVPAHVTVLYPFKPPREITADHLSTLQGLFSGLLSFSVSFAETRRFPDVLYLAPAPDDGFRHLTGVVAGRFPETPPYGGQFAEVIPHLTVAQVGDPGLLDEIAADFGAAASGRLPVWSLARAVTLMDSSSGRWQVRAHFPLRPDAG